MGAKRNIRHRAGQRGQAVIEMALALPFLIWLIYYTLNAFYTVHTSHVAQRFAAMNLWERVGNRAQYLVDEGGVADGQTPQFHGHDFMAVQYTDMDGGAPKRKILLGPIPMETFVGICRQPNCN